MNYAKYVILRQLAGLLEEIKTLQTEGPTIVNHQLLKNIEPDLDKILETLSLRKADLEAALQVLDKYFPNEEI